MSKTAITAALAASLLASAACAHPHRDSGTEDCSAAVGTWIDPATAKTIPVAELLADLARRPVVLLGETHDNAEHHRWQLHTLAALYGRHPDMVLGFESFPRRVQPALDQWVNGELDPVAFLEAADWEKVWGFDPGLYLPLFDFARQNRVPMIALNVDRDFISRIRQEGWAAIPADERQGLSDPVAASPAYRESLAKVYAYERLHGQTDSESENPHATDSDAETPSAEGAAQAGEVDAHGDAASALTADAATTEGEARAPEADADAVAMESDASAGETGASADEADVHPTEVELESILESEDFAKFVGAQQAWDRAMAEAVAAARQRRPDSLVVGILGRGHLEHGYGVPRQLADLGIPNAAVLLPVERGTLCDGLDEDLADAVFAIEPTATVAKARPRPLLGVMLKQTDDGVQITGVMKGSIAESIALQKDDFVVEAAGFPIEEVADLVEVVQRQAPGTWLPLRIRRGGEPLEFVAKFPTVFDAPE